MHTSSSAPLCTPSVTCSTASSDAITAACTWRPDRQRPLSGAVALRAALPNAQGSFDALVLLSPACLAASAGRGTQAANWLAVAVISFVREIPSSPLALPAGECDCGLHRILER